MGNTGEKVSAIGIGTWNIRDRRSAIEALTRAVELGLSMVDTAEIYQAGEAEEVVGEVVKRVGRESVFITTKLPPERFGGEEAAIKAAQASLRRLGVRSADLILIHWPASRVPVATQVKSLEALAEKGLTRYIGVSNFEGDVLEEAIYGVKRHPIVVNQVKYSILDRRVEGSTLPFCVEHKITIQAYTPLERGAVAKNAAINEIAKKYGKTAVQVALNFLISRPMVTAIPKSEKRARVEEFAGALGWRLGQGDLEVLEAL